MTVILDVQNVSKKFDNDTVVLKDISLTVNEGDFISILGMSGSGKTTLLSILGGMEKPSSGKVVLDGEDMTLLSENQLAKLRKTKIGFVFQFFNLAPYLTVRENIFLPILLNNKKIKNYEEKYKFLTKYLKIEDLENKIPSTLSGGEQQRVAIARGLIYNPKIIFLDEPTGNLDSKNSEEIMELLQKINQEFHTTILQVTHSEQNATYGNRIIRMTDGQIIEEIK